MSGQEKSKTVLAVEASHAKAKLYDELNKSNATTVALCYMGVYLVELRSVFKQKGKQQKDQAAYNKNQLAASIGAANAGFVQDHCDLSKPKKLYEANTIGASAIDVASVPMTTGMTILEILQLDQEKAASYDALMHNITRITSTLCDMAATILEIGNLHVQTLEQMITLPHAQLVRSTCNITQTGEAGGEKVVSISADDSGTSSSESELVGEDADHEED